MVKGREYILKSGSFGKELEVSGYEQTIVQVVTRGSAAIPRA